MKILGNFVGILCGLASENAIAVSLGNPRLRGLLTHLMRGGMDVMMADDTISYSHGLVIARLTVRWCWMRHGEQTYVGQVVAHSEQNSATVVPLRGLKSKR